MWSQPVPVTFIVALDVRQREPRNDIPSDRVTVVYSSCKSFIIIELLNNERANKSRFTGYVARSLWLGIEVWS